MKKISSWVILFVQKVKKKISPNKDLADSCYHKGSIGVKDLLQAKWAIVKFIQRWQADKMKILLSWGTVEVNASSSIQKLNPFLDSSGILKVISATKPFFCNKVALDMWLTIFLIWRKNMFYSWDIYIFVLLWNSQILTSVM